VHLPAAVRPTHAFRSVACSDGSHLASQPFLGFQDVMEWLQHHVQLGAGKIYVVDHGSSVPLQGLLQGYIEAGIVDYVYVTVRRGHRCMDETMSIVQ
jgi:Glycosyltransferase family 92